MLEEWNDISNFQIKEKDYFCDSKLFPIIIKNFDGYTESFDKVVQLINSTPESEREVNDSGMDISKSDYKNNTSRFRPWAQYFLPYLEKNVAQFAYKLGFGRFMITSMWFQQYKNMSAHPWHVHNCQYSGVMYLELPKGAPKTEFKDLQTKENFFLPMNQGDIAIFPSFYPHRSPANNANNIKTIVSFNIDFDLKVSKNSEITL